MRVFTLPSTLGIRGDDANESILLTDQVGRIVQYDLAAGEKLESHKTYSPVYFLVIAGQIHFTGADGTPHLCSSGTLVVVEAKEAHTVQAGDAPAVLLTFQFWAPAA